MNKGLHEFMEKDIIEPRIVKSHDVILDAEYAEWIAEVKHRYRSAQIKAAVKVNGEKLLFNWQMGRDLVQKKAEERWGAGVVEQVSLDLQREFPESTNFSVRNLWYMKQWFLFYMENMEKLKQLVSEMLPSEEYERKTQQIDDDGTEHYRICCWTCLDDSLGCGDGVSFVICPNLNFCVPQY